MAATNRDSVIDTLSRAGVAVRTTAINAADGETWTNDSQVYIQITKGAGTTVTGSIAYANAVDGQTVPAKTMAVPASTVKQFGPFPINLFGTTPTITWSGDTTNTTIHLFRPGS